MFQTDSNVTNIATGATGTNATSDGQVTAVHRQRLMGISLTAGSDTATVVIQDANSASGTVLARLSALTNTTTSAFDAYGYYLKCSNPLQVQT